MTTLSRQAVLVDRLRDVLREPSGPPVEVIETHISWVLLTGHEAYKIKKALALGFLDFTALDSRRFYCHEELRLNRRTAPDVYLEVVPITGKVEAPVIAGTGAAIEYAVRMRQFESGQLAASLLATGQIVAQDIDALAPKLAAFHRRCESGSFHSGHGRANTVLQRARDNFSELRRLPAGIADAATLHRLELWTENEFARHLTRFVQRQEEGWVRECHGDLHLGNIARIDGELTLFDCIEFSDDLRWIDVMSDVAFLFMDFLVRGREDYAWRLLNGWLEATGDYLGLALLRFYVVYRAMVRAKIAALQMAQGGVTPELQAELSSHLELGRRWSGLPPPALILMHGFSGSGKTAVSQGMLEAIGAIRLRSDVERKRAAGLDARSRAGSAPDAGLYAPEATEAAYHRLYNLAHAIVLAGLNVIVDATFLRRWQRRLFITWARGQALPHAIVDVGAPEALLRERVRRRAKLGSDASDADLAVLARQLVTSDPLGADERSIVVAYDATRPLSDAGERITWQALLGQLENGEPCAVL
jgi:aminoglycoside phosphotransferase family enzyme/predicted kinase